MSGLGPDEGSCPSLFPEVREENLQCSNTWLHVLAVCLKWSCFPCPDVCVLSKWREQPEVSPLSSRGSGSSGRRSVNMEHIHWTRTGPESTAPRSPDQEVILVSMLLSPPASPSVKRPEPVAQQLLCLTQKQHVVVTKRLAARCGAADLSLHPTGTQAGNIKATVGSLNASWWFTRCWCSSLSFTNDSVEVELHLASSCQQQQHVQCPLRGQRRS
ncbi:hypothetical protein EYF80_065342 [Liparis tanakae]|uniref:Uncharacterized protein n=1 Tax=Liparis tanakae TaxID=230148 RepID=A0A4Z2E8A2_9TELE|nr:hypothetical protein EYF80_065342 [Liparis tanakae]